MIILSWNIENLRFEKVTRGNNWALLRSVIHHCHIAFLYESSNRATAGEIASNINQDYEDEEGDPWVGIPILSLKEYVTCVYNSHYISSVNCLKGDTARVREVSPAERLPPVVLIRPMGEQPLKVAPWHGFGPAKTSTGDLLPRLTKKLAAQGVQLFFGDFNLQRYTDTSSASKRQRVSPRIAVQVDMVELEAEGGRRTSTQNPTGPTARSGPLDRCMRAKNFHARMFQLDPVNYVQHGKLTNHSPLFIFTENHAAPNNAVIHDTFAQVLAYRTPADVTRAASLGGTSISGFSAAPARMQRIAKRRARRLARAGT